MGIFDKFMKPKPTSPPSVSNAEEQAVLLYLIGEDFDRMVTLEDALEAVIKEKNLGMFDGNEIGGGETTLFMYGPNAEALFTHIEPVIRRDDYCQGAVAVIRQGPPGSQQRKVTF